MNDIDRNTRNLDNFSLWKLSSPSLPIDIPANGRDRCNFPKLIEDLRRSHIPGVNDVLRPAQRRHCFVPKQSV